MNGLEHYSAIVPTIIKTTIFIEVSPFVVGISSTLQTPDNNLLVLVCAFNNKGGNMSIVYLRVSHTESLMVQFKVEKKCQRS